MKKVAWFRHPSSLIGGWFVGLAVFLAGCGQLGLTRAPEEDDGAVTDGTDPNPTDSTASKAYVSPGGTAGLSIGTAESGAAALASFDPGAFVLANSAGSEGSVTPAQTEPPPPPPPDGTAPPPPPPDGTLPPPLPPPDGTLPPPPPPDGTLPPPPPPDGTLPPPPPPDGTLPPPPDGSLPPPPPPGGTFPPPPDGSLPPPPPGTFLPPPIPGLSGGTVFTLPDGTVPPPPPEGFEQFGFIDFSSPEFSSFAMQFAPPPPGTPGAPPPGGVPPPPTFATFPFAEFLATNSIQSIIPGVPPKFEPGAAFGSFAFGAIPPPPPGFPPFPPPPNFSVIGGFGGFLPPPLPPGTPPPPGSLPPGVPPPPFGPLPAFPPGPIGAPPPLPEGLPAGFYAFHDALSAMHEFLTGFEFPPPGTGPLGEPGDFPGEGPDGLPSGVPFAFIDFESIAEFLPPGFLTPETVAGIFENFGAGHPLIGDEGDVNPELEDALGEHPPIPAGLDGFDFVGDAPQFDDLFSVYNAGNVGTQLSGQVNATFTGQLDDGSVARCSDTTVLEVIPGQATPLVQMESGVFQTQWVVDIHQTTQSHVVIEHPDNQDGVEFDMTKDVFSQMTWTMLIQEVDTDGDGVVDEIQTSGANQVTVLEESGDGGPPEGLPPLPPPPDLLLTLQFQGVLEVSEPSTEPAPSEPQ